MDPTPEIRTTGGLVQGRRDHTLSVFRGIPYAEPPFGPQRFRAPLPARPWKGVHNALAFGPAVPQRSHPGAVMTAESGCAADGSDNCLTLNIWSPDLTASLPVMVWIHGGAYLEGSAANPHYDGAALARCGVVMVSLNYRTGVEGFAHIAGAPDNRGILDQIAALRWVRDNIAAFGGDPRTVTVFGQSAGAGCIAAQLAMPMAQGLFRRAILQSLPGTYFTPELAATISTTIAAELGVRATLDDLSPSPPRTLLDATYAVIDRMPGLVDSWGPMALTPTPFSPIVDGSLLPQSPWRALENGAAREIDLLVGHTRDEYRLIATHFGLDITEALVTRTLHELAPTPHGAASYRTDHPALSPAELHELVHADWLFRMPTLHLAEAHHPSPTWLYELTWSFNESEGASHSLDFLLLFDTLTPADIRNHPTAHPTALAELPRISHEIRTAWTTFAATGTPGWAPYTPDQALTRIYSATPTTAPYPESCSRRIWQTHPFDVLPLSDSGPGCTHGGDPDKIPR
ncbi:carboxylesterase/lipase family protein [Nocardia sp. NPDC059240]|uniref:carboxylesterase/lipase family protein n=1 Tax=Nocardia sp. NPDC059240 TaxID=3346786 RepID=UPI0036A32479